MLPVTLTTLWTDLSGTQIVELRDRDSCPASQFPKGTTRTLTYPNTTPPTQKQQLEQNAQRNRRPPTPATRRPNPQLRPRPQHRLHALEGPLRSHRLLLAYRRRPFRQHGTRFPARRPTFPVEPRRRDTGGRSRGVQCAREGHSNRASGY